MTSDYEKYLHDAGFSTYLKNLQQQIQTHTVLIYGAGIFFEYINEHYNLSNFNIIGISDKKFDEADKNSDFAGYKIILATEINNYKPDYILVATVNNKKLIKILSETFTDENIKILPLVQEIEQKEDNFMMFNAAKIKLEKAGYIVCYIDETKKEAIFTNGDIKILTDFQYPWVAQEIFADNIYHFTTQLNPNKKYTVIDIGANRCYASLYFAQKDYVKNVYAFELVEQTANFARKVLDLNKKYEQKITLYNYGLGDTDRKITINILPHRDGCNTINQEFLNNHMPEEKNKGIPQVCEIKQASKALKNIVEANDNIILKVDAEGAEYEIFEELSLNFPKIYDKTDLIIGDAHLGFERFYNLLPQNRFRVVSAAQEPDGCCPFEIAKTI